MSSISSEQTKGCPYHQTQTEAVSVSLNVHTAPECSLPRLIQTQLFWHSHNKFLTWCHNRYGDTFRLKVLPWRYLTVITQEEDVKAVFQGDASIYHAGEGNQPLAPVLGKQSVIVIDEDEHLKKRKAMLPPFHGQAVKRYEEAIKEIVNKEITAWPYNKPFSLHPRMRRITLEVILRAVMGVEDEALLETLRQVLPKTVELPQYITWMWIEPRLGGFGPWKKYKSNLAYANQLLLDEVRKRRLAENLENKEDILSILIRTTDMEDEDLRDQLMTMLLAGHETTTTGLSWAMERLLRNPRVLEKIKHEDDTYLDAVIKETLRTRPVIPGVLRTITETVQLNDKNVKRGDTIFPAAAIIHRSSSYYSRPNEFRPERFLEGEGGTYTWIPFGGGRRRCLGAAFATLEMRLCLRAIIEQANLLPDRQTPEKEHNFHITIIPHRGAKVIRLA